MRTEPEAKPTSTGPDALTEETASRPRLLVAEDNPVNQKVAQAMLRRIGYEADVVSDGAKAIEALTGQDYSAVLMDCHMPVMDGYDATVAIRKRELRQSSKRVPIIAMTAAAMEGEREKCLATGMDDYISKPVNLEDLEAVLQRWINGAESSTPTQHSAPEAVEAPHVDPARVTELRELTDDQRHDGFSVIARGFLEDGPARLNALRGAIDSEDAKSVAWEAHALKGAVANLGATNLAALCTELEEVAASGSPLRGRDLIERLTAEFAEVEKAIRAELPGTGGRKLEVEEVDR